MASAPSINQSKERAAILNVQLGLAYLNEDERTRAKQKLITALEQAPDLPDVNEAMAYFLEKTGEESQAQRFYLKAISLSHGAGATLNNYGTFLCRTKRYQQAEDYFIKATRDSNYLSTAGAFENAGLCMEMRGDYVKAMEYFIKALEHDPSRKQSLYELTRIAMKENKPDNALAYLSKYPRLVDADNELNTLKISLLNNKKMRHS